MRYQRSIVWAGVLAVTVGGAMAGLAAERAGGQSAAGGAAEQRTERSERPRRGVFVGPEDMRRAIRLDGRGSQIGVTVSDPDGATAGVRIDGVDEDGPAARAGVTEGDVVVEFDGERVRSARQLTRLVQETADGRTVKMTVARGAARHTLDVTPEAARLASFDVPIDEPAIRAEIERGLRAFRARPDGSGRSFEFRFDDLPPLNGMPGPGARGRLGVEVETLSDQLADYFGARGGGVLVSSVTAESPAAKAGLKAGDVITAVNGTAVRDAGELVGELREVGDGSEVSLEIVRDRKTSTLKAALEPRSAPRPSRRPI